MRKAPIFTLFSSVLSKTPPASVNSEMLQNYYDLKEQREQTQQSKVTETLHISQTRLQFSALLATFVLLFLQSNKRARAKTRGHQRQDSLTMQRTTSPRKKDKQSRIGSVVIYDVQHLLPINKTLAANYV